MDNYLAIRQPEKGLVLATLNRPEAYNALNLEFCEALYTFFEDVPNDTKLIVLEGSGKGFCAGLDLKMDLSSIREQGEATVNAYFNRMVLAMRRCPVPIMAILHGHAAGAGAALALAADLVYMHTDGKLLLPFAKLGLSPDTGASYWLNKIGGSKKAFEWLASGKAVSALEAEQHGLINGVFEKEEDKIVILQQWLSILSAYPKGSIESLKRLLNLGDEGLEQQLQAEAREQAARVKTGATKK
jgi:2-(1,2-epoxy-1,2-dihydrophenyl)acetyl-CoA isomerase